MTYWRGMFDRILFNRVAATRSSSLDASFANEANTHRVAIGRWAVEVTIGSIPLIYEWLTERALLVDEVELKSNDGRHLVVVVHDVDRASQELEKPLLVAAQTYSPWSAGFTPGLLIVPETFRLFIGAGTRLLAYDLGVPARLWADETYCGFWRWGRYRDWVWMAAELEFTVWTVAGDKIWSAPVEPPWDQTFVDDVVELDVMGVKTRRRMLDGSPA